MRRKSCEFRYTDWLHIHFECRMTAIMIRWIFFCMLLGIPALRAKEPPLVQPLDFQKGYNIAGVHPGARPDNLVVWRYRELYETDGNFGADPSRRNIPNPPNTYMYFDVYRQGQTLLAAVRGREGNNFSVCDLTEKEPTWNVYPAENLPRYGKYQIVQDTNGRLLASSLLHGTSPFLFYQEKLKGPVRSSILPTRIYDSGFLLHLTRFNDGARGIWMGQTLFNLTLIRQRSGTRFTTLTHFVDGVVRQLRLPPGVTCTGLLPISDDLLFVSWLHGGGMWIDRNTGKPSKGDTPFSIDALGGACVAAWDQAEDGTVWIFTLDASRHNGEYGQLWRWDGKQLEQVAERVWRSIQHYNQFGAVPMLAFSKDLVLVGGPADGLFYVRNGKAGWIDWQHGLNLSRIDRMWHNPRNNSVVLAQYQAGWFQVNLDQLEKAPAKVKPSHPVDRLYTSLFIRDESNHYAVVDSPDGQPMLSKLREDNWQSMLPIPNWMDPQEVACLGFDSAGGTWLIGHQVMSVHREGDWKNYASLGGALAKELCGDRQGKVEIEWFSNPIFLPLRMKSGDRWFCERNKLFRLSPGGQLSEGLDIQNLNFSSMLFEGEDGTLRFVYDHLCHRLEGSNAVVTAEIPPPRFQPEKLPQYSRNHYQLQHGGFMFQFQHPDRIVARNGEQSKTWHLENTPLQGGGFQRFHRTLQGNLLIQCGRSSDSSRNYLIRLTPDMPRIHFNVEVEVSSNRFDVNITDCEVPSEDLVVQTRIKPNAFTNDVLSYEWVVEGSYELEVRCKNRKEPSLTRTFHTTVQVPGKLKEQIPALVNDLGSSRFERRERAEMILARIGEPARQALEAAQNSEDVEQRVRAEALLKSIKVRQEEETLQIDGQWGRQWGGRHFNQQIDMNWRF